MKFQHLTEAMQQILLAYTRGYTAWVAIAVLPDRVNGIAERWADEYGTRLPAAHRHYRRKKGLPVAVMHDLPTPRSDKRTLILLATSDAPSFGREHQGPWSREKWRTDPIELFGEYVIARDQMPDRSWTWTWKFTPRALGIEQQYLKSLVVSGTPGAIAAHCNNFVRYHPMFGGIRRQTRRLFNSMAKLYRAMHKRPWPGPDPNKLPSVGGFRKTTEQVQAQEAE